MKVVSDYFIRKNGEEYTMIPYGQAIAEHLPELKTNSIGIKIYRFLQGGASQEELVGLLAESLGVNMNDKSLMSKLSIDVESVVGFYRGHGIISGDYDRKSEEYDRIFSIGGIPIHYYGSEGLLDKKLFDFSDESKAEPGIEPMSVAVTARRPRVLTMGNIILRTEDIIITADVESYHIIYLSYRYVRELHYLKRGGMTTIFVAREPENAEFDRVSEGTGLSPRDEVFFAMRTAYLLYAARMGRFALHSASVIYNDKLYLFSAPAGTGKTTHIKLWNQRFKTPTANGDINLIAIEGQKPYVYGIPWCGTSEVYDVKKRPLGGIILLERGKEDRIEELGYEDKCRLVRLRLITPAWDNRMIYDNIEFTESLGRITNIVRLYATMEPAAAECAKAEIDKWNVNEDLP